MSNCGHACYGPFFRFVCYLHSQSAGIDAWHKEGSVQANPQRSLCRGAASCSIVRPPPAALHGLDGKTPISGFTRAYNILKSISADSSITVLPILPPPRIQICIRVARMNKHHNPIVSSSSAHSDSVPYFLDQIKRMTWWVSDIISLQ